VETLIAAVLVTLFVWWFSTGAVLFLIGLPRATFAFSMGGATLLGVGGLVMLHATRDDASPEGAYLAFAGAMAVWAWNEIGFLLGHVTGSRKEACPPGARGYERFRLAAQSILHHEILIAASAIAVMIASFSGENAVGWQVFLVLWLMRLSTKFNIFFGVPNVTVQFLPRHLVYLASYFRLRPMNALFPFSATLGTMFVAYLVHALIDAPVGSGEAVGLALLVTLAALGVIEHWFLVVPLPFGDLWAWGLSSRREAGRDAAQGEAKPAVLAGEKGLAMPSFASNTDAYVKMTGKSPA